MTCPSIVKQKREEKITYRISVEKDKEERSLEKKYTLKGYWKAILKFFCVNLLTCLRFVSFQENLCPVELFSKMLIVGGE
jgi:hypothetical protein